jgi:hypothetical protein
MFWPLVMPESQGIGDNFLMLLGNFTGKKGVGWFVAMLSILVNDT